MMDPSNPQHDKNPKIDESDASSQNCTRLSLSGLHIFKNVPLGGHASLHPKPLAPKQIPYPLVDTSFSQKSRIIFLLFIHSFDLLIHF
jgi:hypothetical protein